MRDSYTNPYETVYETNPQNESFENIKDSWSTIRNESGFVTHDTVQIHGFAKRIHVFTNLLYESRNLNLFTMVKG